MFDYIRGKLDSKSNDCIVVENSGVGFKIYTSLLTIERTGQTGSEVTLYTHLYLREGIMDLYGFYSREERKIFNMLLSVSGIGPKAAISLLSVLQPSQFALAVMSEDAKSLTRAQGIGMKTAQRVILELKDKIKKEQFAALTDNTKDTGPAPEGEAIREAIGALMVLGYTAPESNKAVKSVYIEGMTLEMIIRNALRNVTSRG